MDDRCEAEVKRLGKETIGIKHHIQKQASELSGVIDNLNVTT